MNKELPAWPEPIGKIKRKDTTMYLVAERQRAIADFWEARCRLAVEALTLIGGGLGGLCDETLVKIGPLPQSKGSG